MIRNEDKVIANEHSRFNKIDKYKDNKASVMKVADISQKDINLSKERGYSKLDLDTAKMLSGNPTLTQEELNQLKKAAKDKNKVEPTDKFAK